ncbi:phosphatidylglycerophosphatase A [Methanococcus voltae]|uniref:Phosphatidylglycerophosphatase A n=1 Tax=Methanococcus voltae (strain ATCC BAA-1334 / A3) TaxID=456320 RepID=D7DUL6_METV3|nr:phosphatidylglycerophosphatase A [Methanococcus voltae]MCS3900627.1 alpha-ribazole phosphatase CobZ [Methanococcus voltae]
MDNGNRINSIDNEYIMKKLSKYGVNSKLLLDSGMKMCICTEEEQDAIKNGFYNILNTSVKNPNVYTLLICAILMDEEGKAGNMPFDYESDPTYIYSDEVIGMSIANEIAGTKGTFNFKWYDAKKPGIIGKLDKEGYMYLDDAVAGLVAGCMSKLFENINCK